MAMPQDEDALCCAVLCCAVLCCAVFVQKSTLGWMLRAADEPQHLRTCTKRLLFPVLSLCLSRACLGKIIILSITWHRKKRCVFRRTKARDGPRSHLQDRTRTRRTLRRT